MSIAGGYYKSIGLAKAAGCECVQLFTKSNNQWKAKPITEVDIAKFKNALDENQIAYPMSHASYLINMASPNEELREKSVDAFVIELERAEMLGIRYVVMHPGSFTTSTEEEGLEKIAKSLDEVHCRLPNATSQCLLENTAGQGSNLGNQFEHLQAIIERVKSPERLGVCFDTCHAFAAGYAMAEKSEYQATMAKIENTIGTERIKAFHLNDSKKPFGSRKDRHEAIGKGEMGIEPFRNLLNDDRFKNVPMYMETPKESSNGVEWDIENLATLRSLIA